MAKSKSGGTRSMLRGSIANDVYSIGKDGEGKKQQVVRSRAEEVANPQTEAQMKGRMIMSTVMQAVSAMSNIIDHSFDGVASGQPSISEFIRRNYALVKQDVANHPSSDNSFGLVKYKEKGPRPGAYVVSDGKLTPFRGIDSDSTAVVLSVNSGAITLSKIEEVQNFGAGDYVTMLQLKTSGLIYMRVSQNPTFDRNTEITSDNAKDAFIIEGNTQGTITVSGTSVKIVPSSYIDQGSFICSKMVDGGFIHSKCTLSVGSSVTYTASVALPTYPLGKERFLNGGDA